jgi:hypothetical protein
MLKELIAVQALEDHHLRLWFEDGVTGVVNLKELLPITGVFSPLADQEYFARVRIEPDLGTICWPNGADLDPDVLCALITGEPIPSYEERHSSVPL